MTDILDSSSHFAMWTCVYLSYRYVWTLTARLLVFLPFAAWMLWGLLALDDLVPTASLDIPSSIGRPLKAVLQLATMGLILLFLFTAGRRAHREGADTRG